MRVKYHKLYTCNKPQLISFLCDVLDMELFVDKNGETIVTTDAVAFRVIERAKERLAKKVNIPVSHSMELELCVESEELLAEFKQKAEFYLYRQTADMSLDLLGTQQNRSLVLTDPDGRCWKISYQSEADFFSRPMFHGLSEQQPQT